MQRFNKITRFLICSLLLLHFTFLTDAQETKNPFDLNHRLEEKKEQETLKVEPSNENPFDLSDRKAVVSTIQNTSVENKKTKNPFDVNKTPEKNPTSEIITNETPVPQKKKNVAKDEASGFIFWVMLLMMFFLALEITLFSSLIKKVYRAFTNDNILKLLHREQRDIIAFPYVLLYIFFFVNFGIFSFLTFNYFGFVPKSLNILLYCIAGVSLLFFLKHVLLKTVEYIFPVQKEIKQYSFSLVVFSSILGFALVPFNIIAAFASPALAKIALYGGLITVFGITVFCILRGLFIASKYLSFHKFHFFMYLCTVEIAPVLVVLKILLLKAGIH
jgi:Domain of unknown function (DUF4271)